MQRTVRVGLIGAGYIAQAHLKALQSLPGVNISAVIDADRRRAEALARTLPDAAAYTSHTDALAADAFDRAHVLMPPDLHCPVTLDLLAAGKPVLVEKPVAVTRAQCAALQVAAERAGGVIVGVNQNFLYHPAFTRLRALLAAGSLGRLVQVSCLYNMPLRQLSARQYGHWMFRAPGNILLEQAVHPLSQIFTLIGPPTAIAATAGPPWQLAPAHDFYARLSVAIQGVQTQAQLGFAVGREFPAWRLSAICEDGIATADMIANSLSVERRGRWIDHVNQPLAAFATGLRGIRQAAANFLSYVAATTGMPPGKRKTADAFQISMQASIAAFHASVSTGTPPAADLAFGTELVRACEEIAQQTFPGPTNPPSRQQEPARWDVAILGGTGFIGTHLVCALLRQGKSVSVLARSIDVLPEPFTDPRVKLVRGDIRDSQALETAIGDAPVVVNLAHGGGGANYTDILGAMLGGVEAVANICARRGVRRLVHIGSIAALYLGPGTALVTGATLPDEQAERRADYARAKAACDQWLLAQHNRNQLPVCILRPGIVVGEGASPFHAGVGYYNNTQHCLGWNGGDNPLPFVLVEDVADAISQACEQPDIDGRCYNLVGDVRWTARLYIAELARAIGRPLAFHPQSVAKILLIEYAKWAIKRLSGRVTPPPSRRDLLSRGMAASFDCADAKRDLHWTPVADEAMFRARAIDVNAPLP